MVKLILLLKKVADVAPSILHILGMEQPADMTGENLIEDNK